MIVEPPPTLTEDQRAALRIAMRSAAKIASALPRDQRYAALVGSLQAIATAYGDLEAFEAEIHTLMHLETAEVAQ